VPSTHKSPIRAKNALGREFDFCGLISFLKKGKVLEKVKLYQIFGKFPSLHLKKVVSNF
jgi:hypothetical protein